MSWKLNPYPVKENKEKGVYFIQTLYEDASDGELWDIYNTIRGVESAFRCQKRDLHMRPVYHQNDNRIEYHLYLAMLAYQLVNTIIRHMLKRKSLCYDRKNILRIMSTQKIQTIEISTDKKHIHLRKPAKTYRRSQTDI